MSKIIYRFFLFLLISNIVYPQDRYESFQNWFNALPEYGYDGMKNAFTDKTNLAVIGSAGLSSLLVHQFDEELQDYAQTNGLLPERLAQFGDLYGGTWSALILPVSVIITSKSSNDTNKEMLQKLDYSVSALVANGITTILLKEIIGRKRPNGEDYRSMPSGHSSNSFTVAAVVNEIYGKEAGAVAYLLAGITGISRIHHNKHYLSDVLIGAGFGIIIGRGFAKTYNRYKKTSEFNLSVSFSLN